MNLVCYNAPLEEQAMSARGEVLVAIVNNVHDFAVARDHHWYRVPIDNVEKRLKNCWPPQWLAFYQTKDFGEEAYAVHYYARVLSLRERGRHDLFPDEPPNAKSHRRYYQLMLDHLQRLPTPIVSRRFRRVIFIPTTMMKLYTASELNDLWDESPLEDALWEELKRRDVVAERQEFVEVDGRPYFLDFAIYCAQGKLDVETDGDTWHIERERAREDNVRDNDLETAGWSLLRFNTQQIHEEMASYCVPKVVEKINKLGGLETRRLTPQMASLDPTGSPAVQGVLFDGMLIAPDADEGSEGVILPPLPASEPSAEARQAPLVDVPPDAPPQRKKRRWKSVQ